MTAGALSTLVALLTTRWTLGAVLSSGKVEMCHSYSAAASQTSTLQQQMNCSRKLIVNIAVENGQNATDSIHALGKVQDLTASGAGGGLQQASDDITIVISKTPIFVRYSTMYKLTYNNQPWHMVKYNSRYSTFPKRKKCNDSPGDSANTCGRVIDPYGKYIDNSQGYCCSCDALGPLFQDPQKLNLECAKNAADFGQKERFSSAHCLRMDPLDYHAFTIGEPETWFQVHIAVKWCTKQGSCKSTDIVLGPDSTSGQLQAGINDDRTVIAALIGDFASWKSNVHLSNKLLFVPAATAGGAKCTKPHVGDPSRPSLDMAARCRDRLTIGPRYWMFIDKSHIGSDSQCDVIGTGYTGFRSYGLASCDRTVSDTCLAHQLQDHFDEKKSFAKDIGGGTYAQFQSMTAGLHHGISGGRVSFRSSAKQATLVQLVLDADKIRWEINVHPGKIVDAYLKDFEQNSEKGLLLVTVADLGACAGTGACSNAAFEVTIRECTKGVQPMMAQSISLAAGQVTTPPLLWAVEVDTGSDITVAGRTHYCTIALKDATHAVVDQRIVYFNSTQTSIKAPHRGTVDEDKSKGDVLKNSLLSATSVCDSRCGIFGVTCMVLNFVDCYEHIILWGVLIAVAVGVVVLLCVGCRVFGIRGCIQIIFCPAKFLCQICKCIEALRCKSRYPRTTDIFFGDGAVQDEWSRRKRVRREREMRRGANRTSWLNRTSALESTEMRALGENELVKTTSVGHMFPSAFTPPSSPVKAEQVGRRSLTEWRRSEDKVTSPSWHGVDADNEAQSWGGLARSLAGRRDVYINIDTPESGEATDHALDELGTYYPPLLPLSIRGELVETDAKTKSNAILYSFEPSLVPMEDRTRRKSIDDDESEEAIPSMLMQHRLLTPEMVVWFLSGSPQFHCLNEKLE